MSQLTLTYFDMHGGRAEAARLALHIGGIAFEDKRFAFADFAEVRKTTPLNQVPTLHVDGVQVTQSDAITTLRGQALKPLPHRRLSGTAVRRGDGCR
jgi:glutathione S-transferase